MRECSALLPVGRAGKIGRESSRQGLVWDFPALESAPGGAAGAGGVGADVITGAAGNDLLFSTSAAAADAADADADNLDGGLGDDTLALGNTDVATGGDGADSFVLMDDANGAITITDFDAASDVILVEAATPGDVSIASQDTTTSPGNLIVTLSTGATLTLQGVTAEIPASAVSGEAPGTTAALPG